MKLNLTDRLPEFIDDNLPIILYDDYCVLISTQVERNFLNQQVYNSYFLVFTLDDKTNKPKLVYDTFAFKGKWEECNKPFSDLYNEANYIYRNIEYILSQIEMENMTPEERKQDILAGIADIENDERKLNAN